MLRQYLQDNILITDGAMGTYYAAITGTDGFPELANLNDPKTVERIHSEYIAAGAKLIKTNTFSASSITLNIPRPEVRKIVVAGVEIANRAACGNPVFVAASIGPIPDIMDKTTIAPDVILDEYKFLVDTFLASDIKIFIFETFGDVTYLNEISKYIKDKDESAFMIAQFATTPEGYTRNGVSVESIVAAVKACPGIDAYGFNCGVGPTHLLKTIKKLDLTDDIIAIAPNAGYPEIIHERTVYTHNTGYFAERMKEISELGAKILGGCCGTTPAHIQKMAELIKAEPAPAYPKHEIVVKNQPRTAGKSPSGLSEKITDKRFIIAVELDPPFNADSAQIVTNARICKEHGVDLITIADSPMGRARVDSVMLAAKIKREVGIEVMPHICCRDKNINALKSTILAGYIENIRNILAVTGDPVATADRNDIKGVFNLNSFKLIELLAVMNKEFFAADPLHIAAAMNLNLSKPDGEVARSLKKSELGAALFLTQPIFDDPVIAFLPEVKKRDNLRVLGGIMPLVSYRNAQFLNNEVAGISIPDKIIQRFSPDMAKEEAENLGIEIALEIAAKIKNNVHGFYFITPFNRVEMIVKIINKLA